MIHTQTRHLLNTLLILALTFGLAAPAWSDRVYRHVDEEGNVTFSDEPPGDGAEEIKMQPITTMPLPRPQQRQARQTTREETAEESPAYDTLAITKPEHDTAFWRASGDIVIEVNVQPELRPSHSLELELDGERIQQTRNRRFEIINIDRGTHEAVVHIINANGETLQSSELSRFTVHQPSRLHRQ